MNTMSQDFRYAFRTIARNPGFTLVAVLTLAMGIGSSTAIFMVANSALLRPLPYPESERLVTIQGAYPAMGDRLWALSSPELIDIRERFRSLERVGAIWSSSRSLIGDGDPEQIEVGEVTAEFFATLGVAPALGRTFVKDELVKGGPKATMLSDGLWRRRFAADSDVLGKSLMLNGVERTIIGVMPSGFRHFFPKHANVAAHVDAWAPLEGWEADSKRSMKYLKVVARLRPGITIEQARSELSSISKQINDENPFYAMSPIELRLDNLQDEILKPVRSSVIALLVGVGFLFLVACTNFTNLLLARVNERHHEMAVRMALGAGRWSLFRQLLLENLSLSALACVSGVLVAVWGLELLEPLMPASLTLNTNGPLDSHVIAFIAVTGFVLPALMGTLPMMNRSAVAKLDPLRQGGRAAGERGQKRLRQALVIGEIALSLVLLIGAGLMIRTFTALQSVNPGYEADGVLTFRVALPRSRYADLAANANFYDHIRRKLLRLPGVEAVGGVSHHPFSGRIWAGPYLGEGTSEDKWDASRAEYHVVTLGYFEVVQARLLEGRVFTEFDSESAEKVVIVDKKLASTAWPGELAVGKKVRLNRRLLDGYAMKEWARVIGVVDHMRSESLREDGSGQIYLPCTQTYARRMTVAVRTVTGGASISTLIRREVAMIDEDLPIFDLASLDSYVSSSVSGERFVLILSSFFASASLALAAVGIYSVISYSVTRRTKEFGIRMALGAKPSHIRKQVVAQGAWSLLFGVGAGLLMAFVLMPLLGSLVFGVRTTDPLTFAFVSAFLATVVIGASYIPARRATKVDPMVALRCD